MKNRTISVVCFAALTGVIIALAYYGSIHNWWREMKRRSQLSQTGRVLQAAFFCMNHSLSSENWRQYDLAQEMLRYPDSFRRCRKNPVKAGRVVDAWGSPIRCTFTEVALGLEVELRSAGYDLKMDTDDDIVEEFFFLGIQITQWSKHDTNSGMADGDQREIRGQLHRSRKGYEGYEGSTLYILRKETKRGMMERETKAFSFRRRQPAASHRQRADHRLHGKPSEPIHRR